MKNLLFCIIILSLFVSVTYAQIDSTDQKENDFYGLAMKQYMHSLNHFNNGVVESTIIHLIKFKIECPDISFEKAIDSLNIVVVNGRTSSIRLMALIAAKYLENPEAPGFFSEIKIENEDQLISMLLRRLH